MFHVSRQDLGRMVTLIPRIPRSVTSCECQITPRVCFSPTVEQCVIGMVGYAINPGVTLLGAFMELANPDYCPTVYYTDETLFEPEWVSDFHITHEEWALLPIAVERIGYIDCLSMVIDKKIVIVEEPIYINNASDLLMDHISEKDRLALLSCHGIAED